MIEQKSVKDFIERKINNSETINKKISSYTTTKISIEDLKKSIKDLLITILMISIWSLVILLTIRGGI